MTAVNFNQSNAQQVLANRQQRQDARIQQGIQSGELTPREAQRLQARESRIDARIQKQESQPGGMTAAQFHRDMFRMDGASLGIWQHKHNDSQATPPATGSPQGGTANPGGLPAPTTDPTQAAAGTPGQAHPLLSGLQDMVSQLQQLVQQLTTAGT